MGAWGAWDGSHRQDRRVAVPRCSVLGTPPVYLPGHPPPLRGGRQRVGGVAGLRSMGRKLLESCLHGGVSLPVPTSQRLSGVATCQVPDSECSSDRATGCRNALALHEFTWYLVCAQRRPGSKADQPAPKERGGALQRSRPRSAGLGKTEARANPHIGSAEPAPHYWAPTSVCPPGSALSPAPTHSPSLPSLGCS